MNAIRRRLTYANVMSSLAVFLVLGGATAFAASHLGKNAVGSKQLKKNSVTAAKIKKNAVTAAKIKANAVTSAKVANGSITGVKVAAGSITGSNIAPGSISGAQINGPSTAFTQVVARLRAQGPVNFSSSGATAPLGAYTQPVGEDDQYLGGVDVNFPATCTGKRKGAVLLVENAPASLSELQPSQILGVAIASDNGGSAKSVRAEFFSFSIEESGGTLTHLAPAAATPRSFSVLPIFEECEGGSEGGITVSNLGLDVLGTR